MTDIRLTQHIRSHAGKISLVYFTGFIALGMTSASLGPTLDQLAAQTSASLDKISILFPLRSFGYMLGALIAGRLYDRLDGHRLMALALLLMAAMVFFTPITPVFIGLLFTLLVIGLGEGMLDVGGNTLIVWLHGKGVGPYMNALHFFYGVGALLAPLVVGEVMNRTDSITWAYWIIALMVLPALLGILRTSSPVNPNQTDHPENASADEPGGGLILLLILFFILYVAAEVSFGGWIYLYAINATGALPVTAAYITSAFWGAFTVGRLLGIPISARLRPRQILQIDFAGALLSLSVILVWPNASWALWTGTIGFGFFIASIFPTMITFAGSRMTVTGKVTGYFFLGATLGGMILPWVIGQFFETVSPSIMTWTITASITLAIFTALAISRMFSTRSTA